MAEADFSDIYLERVDPSRNLARFYAVSIQLNLFGEPTLIRMFGRIDKVGHALVETFADVSSAELARTTIVQKKLKRGYVSPATAHQP